MIQLPSVSDFNDVHKIKNLSMLVRSGDHIVNRIRTALQDYETKRLSPRPDEWLAALGVLAPLVLEYILNKVPQPPIPVTNKKHIFMMNLSLAITTLQGEIAQHAANTAARFRQPHFPAALPGTARMPAAGRLTAGVSMKPTYQIETFQAKHNPQNRMHGGDFVGHNRDVTTMNDIDLYTLVKRYKHTGHQFRALQYFNATDRVSKQLTAGAPGQVMLNGAPADTFGMVARKQYDDKTGRFTGMSGQSYMQNSGANDGFAVYVCDIAGDFFVHLDLADHAGTFQHSSVMSGADVTCAGTIVLDQGRVVVLTNNSGHYQPSPQNLRDAMVLMQEDLLIDPRTVMIMVTVSEQSCFVCSGETLLQLQAHQTMANLPPGECFDIFDATIPAAKNLGADRIRELARREMVDQKLVIQRLLTNSLNFAQQAAQRGAARIAEQERQAAAQARVAQTALRRQNRRAGQWIP